MPRASDAQKAQRLNRARELLRQFKERAQAVTELARECSISPRQAHRYIQHAQQLKQPIPVSEGKLAFTIKLPRSLIQRVRLYARARKLSGPLALFPTTPLTKRPFRAERSSGNQPAPRFSAMPDSKPVSPTLEYPSDPPPGQDA